MSFEQDGLILTDSAPDHLQGISFIVKDSCCFSSSSSSSSSSSYLLLYCCFSTTSPPHPRPLPRSPALLRAPLLVVLSLVPHQNLPSPVAPTKASTTPPYFIVIGAVEVREDQREKRGGEGRDEEARAELG
eukprot:761837-Hanusia_phi.AAC.2